MIRIIGVKGEFFSVIRHGRFVDSSRILRLALAERLLRVGCFAIKSSAKTKQK